MKKDHLKSEIEVFICNHKRDDKEDCFSKGGKELTDGLKKWAKEKTDKKVKVFRSGCLGKCSEGIAVLCYPKKEFFLEATPSDYQKIKEQIKAELD